MTKLIDFLPVSSETIDTIRARMDAGVNAGVDPSSADFKDTTPGGFWFDITQVVALELARLYDLASVEVPAAMFAGSAWGDYLDDHAEALGLTRKPATPATGSVTFTGTDGTVVAANTEVSTVPVSDDDEPISYVTTASGTIASGTLTLAVQAANEGAAGNLGSGTVVNLVSPNSGVSAVNNAAAMTGGADVENDEDLAYRVLLKLRGGSGAGTSSDYEQWALAYPGVIGAVVEPVWNGAGTVRVVLTAAGQGPVSDAIKYGLQDVLDPPGFLTATTGSGTLSTSPSTVNVTTTGTLANSGTIRVGTKDVTYTGKTGTTFTGCTIASGSYAYASGARVAALFDKGNGLAPVGAVVTVDTVTSVNVTVSATVTHETGYNLTGSGGNIATATDITAALTAYINSLRPGDDVVLNHVIGQFFRVTGVIDVASVLLNGSGSNVAIAALEVAKISTVTLS